LQAEAPPRRLEELIDRLGRQFPPSPVDEEVDRAFTAGERTFTVIVTIPDELVPAAILAVDELGAVLAELDRWTADERVGLLPASPAVRAHIASYLDSMRTQLEAGLTEVSAAPRE
jgi:hypothetical protein